MRSLTAMVLTFTLIVPSLSFGAGQAGGNEAALVGYSPRARASVTIDTSMNAKAQFEPP